MYATRPASTTTSTRVDFRPLTSALSPPGVDAGAEDERRHDEERHPEDSRRLARRDGQTTVARRPRPDRNQVLLLREPVDRVEEQILVHLNADGVVGREVRIADRHEARLGRPRIDLGR